jgi:hypothetical protein
MKKLLFSALIGLTLIGFGSAQQGWMPNPGIPAQTVAVSGTLQLQNGSIAVVNGNAVYYVPALERYIGFIEGLKEGTPVNVEGYVYNNRTYAYLQPSKLTFNGKSYDFPADNFAITPRNGRNNTWGNRCCW